MKRHKAKTFGNSLLKNDKSVKRTRKQIINSSALNSVFFFFFGSVEQKKKAIYSTPNVFNEVTSSYQFVFMLFIAHLL